MSLTKLAIGMAERGLMPDFLLRHGIRHLLKVRLVDIHASHADIAADEQQSFLDAMDKSVIAPVPEMANQQHYEVPAAFYRFCLGPNRKYSSCYWDESTQTLEQAELLALQKSAEHADLANGQHILELGCGWGSWTLWMAANYPDSTIVAVSNSNSQREFIMNTAAARGLSNIRVLTCDMNYFNPRDFQISHQFDRVVSIEMFEHMRNYKVLYSRVAEWLKPGGKFFKHIFVHRLCPYEFKVSGPDDWMSQFFFSGGIMPSDDLPLHFQNELKLIKRWRWDGTHYEKTANAWLENMDIHHQSMTSILSAAYGDHEVEKWRNRWRIFFMACAELFGFNDGQEWWVSHYLFEKPVTKTP